MNSKIKFRVYDEEGHYFFNNRNNKNAHITEVCQGKLNKTCGHSFKYLREEEMTY